MTALSALRDQVEEWMQDSSNGVWSATRVDRQINRAYWRLARDLSKIRNRSWFVAVEDFNLAADTQEYDLSNLTRTLRGVKFLEKSIDQSWFPVPRLEEGQQYNFRSNNQGRLQPAYYLRMENAVTYLGVLPTSAKQETFKITYGYEPAALSADDDEVQTPDHMDDVIELRAAIFLHAQEDERDQQKETLLIQRMAEILADEEGSDMEVEVLTSRDVTSTRIFGGL